jgi:hypothetical protein
MMRQPTIEEMRAALEATRLPPKDGFDRMVAEGLINAQGQLTRLYGGRARAGRQKATAVEFGQLQRQDPRIGILAWLLDLFARFTPSQIVSIPIHRPTATRIAAR